MLQRTSPEQITGRRMRGCGAMTNTGINGWTP
jgi:hypothetical protein